MRKLLLSAITLFSLICPVWAQPDWATVEEREGGFSFRAPADWNYRGKAMMGRYVLEFPAGNLVIRVEKSSGKSIEQIAEGAQALQLEQFQADAKPLYHTFFKRNGVRAFECATSGEIAAGTPRSVMIQRFFVRDGMEFALTFTGPDPMGPGVRSTVRQVLDTFAPHP